MINKTKDHCQLYVLIGLGFAEFERLLPVFSAVYEAKRQVKMILFVNPTLMVNYYK